MSSLAPVLCALAALAVTPSAAQSFLNDSADYTEGKMGLTPVQHFKSFNSSPPLWNYEVYPADKEQEGSLFMALWGSDWAAASRSGPYITDNQGNLIWDGTAPPYNFTQTMSFAPFTYQNQSVLALWQGKFDPAGYGHGYGLVLDNTYTVVANITATVANATQDFHEFAITKNGTALITVYNVEPYNISSWGVPKGNNSDNILLGYAQEIDIATNKELFTWRSLDHVDPHDCYATPQDTVTNAKNSWDYFHINSIEKDDKGNFLISSRHCHTVYYVDGRNGSIIWQVGGKNSTFEMGPGVEFNWQHYARFRDNSSITLFDNGGAVWPPNFQDDATSARAIHFAYDEQAKTTKLLFEALPFNHTTTRSQGSIDLQPNGNWLVGWGGEPYYAEFAPDGPVLTDRTGVELNDSTTPGLQEVGAKNLTMLWSAQYAALGASAQSYRLHRSIWTAFPKTSPNLTAETNGSSTVLYMSWNGATEVASWEVLAGNDTQKTGSPIGTADKNGFETSFSVPQDKTANVYQVRAVGKDNSTLGFSEFVASNGTDVAPPSAAQSSLVSHAPQPSFSGNTTVHAKDGGKKSAAGKTATSTLGVVALAALAWAIL